MKRKRARPQTAQERFFEVFAGDEHLWSRLFGHLQGDGHVTKKGDAISLGTITFLTISFRNGVQSSVICEMGLDCDTFWSRGLIKRFDRPSASGAEQDGSSAARRAEAEEAAEAG